MQNKKEFMLQYTGKISLGVYVVLGQDIKIPEVSIVIDMVQGSKECLLHNKI